MALHRLTSISVGVPQRGGDRRVLPGLRVDPWRDLRRSRRFGHPGCGEQLRITTHRGGQLLSMGVGAHGPGRPRPVRTSLTRLDPAHRRRRQPDRVDPHSRLEVTVEVASPVVEDRSPWRRPTDPAAGPAERRAPLWNGNPVLLATGAPGDRLSRPGKPPSGSSSTGLGFKIAMSEGRGRSLRCWRTTTTSSSSGHR